MPVYPTSRDYKREVVVRAYQMLVVDGAHMSDVVKELGVPHGTLRTWIRRGRWEVATFNQRKVYTDEDREHVRDLLADGLSRSDVALQTGIDITVIIGWCKTRGFRYRHSAHNGRRKRFVDCSKCADRADCRKRESAGVYCKCQPVVTDYELWVEAVWNAERTKVTA